MRDFEDEAFFGRRGGFGGPFRAGRGMMEPAILGVLLERPMHGYEIMKTLEEHSHGVWRPSPGSVYPTLQLLEEKGHVTSKEEAGKKVYSITKEGQKLAEATAEQRAHWRGRFAKREEVSSDMRHLFGSAMRMMRQISLTGNDQQKKALDTAIHEFYNKLSTIYRGDAS